MLYNNDWSRQCTLTFDMAMAEHAAVFALGVKFECYDHLEETLKAFEDKTYSKFWKREARTIEAARKRTDRHLNPRLKYYQLKFTCIHGGQSFRPKGKGSRSTS